MAKESLIGKVVGGCKILSEIASGGMGEIFKARQLSLDREVAVKILADRLAGDPTFVERFQREARAISRVNHPNILIVYDVGCEQNLDVHYMIMELIDGQSLSEIIQDQGVLSPKVASDYISQAALGLGCAQAAGVAHRDVKPDNIMVTRQNVVKVSDFGLAKEIDASGTTAAETVMGSPAYMSPEQCDGKTLDGRTDIYSLGGTFFRLLTGRLPFEAETSMSMMYRHKHEPVTPPRHIDATIPKAVSDVVVRMMAKRREDRYQTMEEVAEAIKQAGAEPGGASGAEQPAAPGVDLSGAGGASAHVQAGVKAPDSGIITSPRRREVERLIAQGDTRLRRGDLAGAARAWREAGAIEPDPRIPERLEKHVRPEVEKGKKAGEQRMAEGSLSEAARAFREVVEIDPGDEDAQVRLREIEERIAKRREAVNLVRQLLASTRFEEAVIAWDELTDDVHDESLERQIKQVRDVVLPVKKLCDQADKALAAGELDQSIGLYRRAADVDIQSERAKSGVREAERRRNRMERMLKEGYEFNVKEDYGRAIEAWEGILKIAPDHARAKKLITETRLRLGHSFRQKEGRIDEAIEQWKKIVELDPEHTTARVLLEDDLASKANLAKLSEEAHAAYSRRKYGRAIYAWQKMLDVDPNNRKVAGALGEAKRIRRKRRTVLFVTVFVVVIVGGTGGQIAREQLTLKKAARLESKGKLGDAVMTIDAFTPSVFFRDALAEKRRDLAFKTLFRKAKREQNSGNYDRATEIYERARDFAKGEQLEMVENEIERAKVIRVMNGAAASEKAGRWDEAKRSYRVAAEMARKAGLKREFQKAEKRAEFARLVRKALDAERKGQRVTAKGFWQQARNLDPDHGAVKKATERLNIPD